MTTLTFGSTGTYSTLVAAWNAAVWTDDHLFLQVGASTETTSLSYKNQGGFDAIIRGDLSSVLTHTPATYFIYLLNSGQPSGNFTIENIVVNQTGLTTLPIIRFNYSSGSPSSYTCSINRLKMTFKGAAWLQMDGVSGFGATEVWCNHVKSNFSRVNPIININSAPSGTTVSIEDNLFEALVSSARVGFKCIAGDTSRITARRNYFTGYNANSVFSDAASTGITNASTDTYTDTTDTDLSVAHTSLPFDLTQFVSITPIDTDFGIPLATSLLTIDATQTSDIPDNLVGLNGVTVSTRAAGPYAPDEQILAPTGLGYSLEGTGVVLTWTDTIQAGYNNVNIFWETVPSESAFITPKDSVAVGVETYTIPYASLSSDSLWYVRLTHSE